MDASVAKTGANSKRFIQISDCHLGPLTSEALLGLNTDESLKDVLALIAEKELAFDFMVCTGDIASAGHESCYRRFLSIVRDYFSAPLAWLPGNHDCADIMSRVTLPYAPEARVIDLGKWVVVLLNSVVPFKVHGNFEQGELDYLEQMLVANPDKHIMVMLHHQPVMIGSQWIDQYVLRNADAFFAIIDRFPNLRAIVWGHVHQEFSGQRNGVALIATPATCVQFKPRCDEFTVDTLMPGYRWFDLHDNGTFKTGVERVTGKQYVIDYKSAGY